MSKIRIAVICFILCSFCSVPAKAQVKFDFGSMGTSITEIVGRVQTKISDVQRYVQNQVTMLTRLAGEAKGLIADVKGKVDAAKNAVNAAKGAVDSAKNFANAAASGDINGAMGAAQNMASAAQNATSAAGNAASAMGVSSEYTETASKALEQAQEMRNLEINLGFAKEKLQQALQDIEDKKNAEIQKYKDNNKVLEESKAKAETDEEKKKYQEAIDKNNAKIKEISDKYAAERAKTQEDAEKTMKEISKSIDGIKSAAAKAESLVQNMTQMANLSNLTQGIGLKGSLSLKGITDDPGESMNAIIKNNFYEKNEEESSKRNGEIIRYRRQMAIEDTADVYATAISVLSEDDTLQDTIKEFEEKASTAETEQGMLQLDMKIKVEQMNQLLKFARLILIELKMETAKDMVYLNRRLNNYDKDVLVFSLDDYKFEKQSFLSSLKEKAGKANDLLGKIGGLAEKASSVTGSSGLGNVSNAINQAGSITGKISGSTGIGL